MEYVFVSSWFFETETWGIKQYRFDPSSGEMEYIRTFGEDKSCNVSWIDKKRNILYVLNEEQDLKSMRIGGGGEILTYRLEPETGDVTLLNATPTFCSNPCYLSLDLTGEYLVVANHGTGAYVTKIKKDGDGKYCPVVLFDDSTVELFAVNEDGSVGELLDVVAHIGNGPGRRQTNAHPHSAVMSPCGDFFAVCDKGNDSIYMYQIDRELKKLVACPNQYKAPLGFMPRYCVFHPSKPFFYHNNEGSMNLCAYVFGKNGTLTPIGSYPSLEGKIRDRIKGPSEQQGLCMDTMGTYIYDVLNGPNQVAVFQIDQEKGSLKLIQNQPVEGAWPRGVALSPNGRFLIVTCLKGEKVIVYRVKEDGTIAPTGFEYNQPYAAYATFWNTEC